MSGGDHAPAGVAVKAHEFPTPPGSAGRRQWLSPRYLVVVGALLVGALSAYIGIGRIGEAMLSIQPAPLAAMMGVLAITLGLRALKWRIALGPNQHAAALFFLSKGAGDWTPGRIGEFSPLLLARHRNARIGAWIAYDRLLEMSVTAAMGLLGVGLLGWLPWSVVIALALTGGAVIMAGLWWLPRTAPPGGEHTTPLGRAREIARTVLHEIWIFRTVLPAVLPLTILGKAADLLSVWLLFVSFGESVPAALIMTTRCARAILASFPVTADLTGVPHATELGMLHEAAGVATPIIFAALVAEIAAYSAVFWPLFAFAIWRYRRPENIHA